MTTPDNINIPISLTLAESRILRNSLEQQIYSGEYSSYQNACGLVGLAAKLLLEEVNILNATGQVINNTFVIRRPEKPKYSRNGNNLGRSRKEGKETSQTEANSYYTDPRNCLLTSQK